MNIQNPHLPGLDAGHARLKRQAALASLAVAGTLVAAKTLAWGATDSVSVLSSLMDSAFDTLASLAVFYGIVHAASPADKNHRFGHGKIEALAALAQAVFIAGAALFLLLETVPRFLHPSPLRAPAAGVGIMLLSVALTLGLVFFQRHVIRKTGSVAVSADNLHYRGDLVMNAGVIAALVLGGYGGPSWIDPLFAGAAALVMLRGARGIGSESLDILMDRELPEADRARIMALVNAHAAVRAVHDLRTRSAGTRLFIEFHMELDGDLSLRRAHDVTEEVEGKLYDAFPSAEVIIHQEPAGIDDHRIDAGIAAGE